MAIPLDMDDSGTKGRYDPISMEVTRNDARGSPLSHQLESLHGSKTLHDGDIAPIYGQSSLPPRSLAERFDDAVESLQSCYAKSCGRLPTFLVVLFFLALIGVLIVLAVVLFVLVAPGEQQPLTMRGQAVLASLDARAGAIVWPKMADDGDQQLESSIPRNPNVSSCLGYGFSCTTNPTEVIASTRRCDGVPDCADSSDETACKKCNTRYGCPNTMLRNIRGMICLTPEQICDGIAHCPDRWDEEEFCRDACKENEFPCSLKNSTLNMCLPQDAICDGVRDCPGGEDEKDCKDIDECSGSARMCKAEGKCLPARKICDGVKDCTDGSDEQDCNCYKCSGTGKNLCDDGTCITMDKLCDGTVDCGNDFDEQGCP